MVLPQNRQLPVSRGHVEAALGDALRGDARSSRPSSRDGRRPASASAKGARRGPSARPFRARTPGGNGRSRPPASRPGDGWLPALRLRTPCCGSPRRPSRDARGRRRRAARRTCVLARASAIAVAGAGREKSAEDAVLGVEHRQVLVGNGLDARPAPAPRARSATCAALRSCVGVSRSSPSARSSAAAMALAAFRLKSPISAGCGRPRSACSKPADRTRMGQPQLSRKSTMRSSPGFSTRGLATRGCQARRRARVRATASGRRDRGSRA